MMRWWWWWTTVSVSMICRSCSLYGLVLTSGLFVQLSESFLLIPTTTTFTSTRNVPIHHNHQRFHDELLSNYVYSVRRHGRITVLSSQQQNTIEKKEKATMKTRTKHRSWEESYQLLVSYNERNGNCNVPQRYKDDLRLGRWVSTQRKTKDKLSDERIAKLDDLGFSWSNELYEKQWEECYQLLVSYKEKHGNCNVPTEYKDDSRLGYWVQSQRRTKDRLSDERIAKLDDLGFSWSNELYEKQWEECYQLLVSYKEKHGNCNVPTEYKNDSRLGYWVQSQRRTKASLSDDRIVKLDAVGFSWANEIHEDQWEEMFEKLVLYAKENFGDCNIPYKNDDNDVKKELAMWVGVQRKRKSLLSEECRTKLENLGLIWEDANKVKADQKWNEKYKYLKDYKEEFGHCRVPQKWKVHPSLGFWVYNQRQKYRKGELRKDRISKLEEIRFTWKVRDAAGGPDYVKLDSRWLVTFGTLLNFLEEHGHCDVPINYKKDKSLGQWVYTQRQKQKNGTLREEREERLADISFTWNFDDQKDEQWNEKYQELKHFKEQNGHLRLPETSQSLSTWVSQQRVQFASGKVEMKRKARLDELGFRWKIYRKKT